MSLSLYLLIQLLYDRSDVEKAYVEMLPQGEERLIHLNRREAFLEIAHMLEEALKVVEKV